MQNVDFLPSEYRQRYARQRHKTWRSVVLGIASLSVLLAAIHQSRTRRLVEQELAATIPRYEKALATTRQLGQVQSELALAKANADLFTWLRHPWPRSQILASLLQPLPAEIGFTRLEIRRQPQAARARQETASFPGKSGTADPAAEPPAVRDLEQLRAKFDAAPTVVSLEGVVTESSVLHQYLADLNRQDLFLRAELESLEADRSSDASVLRFKATLTVRPGYGVPGGPSQPPEATAAAMPSHPEHGGDKT